MQHNSARSVPDAARLPMSSPFARSRSISRNLRAIHALGVREAAGRDQRIGARRVRGVDVVLLQYGVSERLSGRGPGVGDAWPSIAPKAGLSAPDRRSLSSRSPDGPRRPQPRCCSTSPKLRLWLSGLIVDESATRCVPGLPQVGETTGRAEPSHLPEASRHLCRRLSAIYLAIVSRT